MYHSIQLFLRFCCVMACRESVNIRRVIKSGDGHLCRIEPLQISWANFWLKKINSWATIRYRRAAHEALLLLQMAARHYWRRRRQKLRETLLRCWSTGHHTANYAVEEENHSGGGQPASGGGVSWAAVDNRCHVQMCKHGQLEEMATSSDTSTLSSQDMWGEGCYHLNGVHMVVVDGHWTPVAVLAVINPQHMRLVKGCHIVLDG